MAKKNSKAVFVVYGRNEKIRKSMFSFLRSLDLKPLQWEQMVRETEKTTPHIGEVLEKGFEIAQAVVVIMTPDDEARLKKEFHGSDEKHYEVELTGQPRQNVLIEAGMALGKNADKTIIVEIGKMREISDFSGKNVVKLDNTVGKRTKLISRLKIAKCEIDDSSEDWVTEGDFTIDEVQKESETTKTVKKQVEEKQSHVKEKTSGDYGGLSGGIRLLIDEGFFNTVKMMGEIIEELESRGYVYPRPSARKLVMVFAKKKKILNAIKRGKNTVYVIRR